MSLPWSGVEGFGDSVVLVLSQPGHAGVLWQVLTDQPVGVLVGAALPGVMRVRKVERDTCGPFDVGVAVELRAVVSGDRLEEFRVAADQLDGAG
jgi:hypothetical protein